EHKANRLSRGAEHVFEAILAGYDRSLRWVLSHQPLMLLVTLGLIALTGYLYVIIPKGFFPQQDTGFISGQVQARQDISFAGMTKVVHQVADIVRKDPAVHAVVEFAGATGGNSTESTARMMIQLKSFGDRNVSVQQVIQRLRPKMLQVVGAKVFFQAGQDVTIGGRVSQAQYQYTLSDTNTDELNEWAPKIQQGMQQIKVLQDVATDQQIASPHVTIDIDRNTASRLGISLQTIDNTLYDAFGQSQIGTIYAPTNQYKVILEAQPQFQDTPDALERIYVPNSAGGQVPLSAIAHFGTKVEPLTVNHQGQFPAVTLSFNLAPGASLSQAVDEIQAMQDKLHVPQTLQGSFQGTAQAFQDSLTSTPLLVAAAIFVVYIVLGMLYESYIHPITILSALPSAGVGALIMLMATGYDLDVIGLIGIILLIGIVKKNAIMMIDFALEAERDEGLSPQASIHKACILRFRPIMMTTFCALFAGLPLAVGTGAGSELRRPMGIAIVGGLLVSQVLTLYTTPVIYLYLDRAARWVSTKFRRKRMPQPAAVGE
ncbi:MAG TPA: efflux RND transporter permease subunit, partial [Stellaceae bacterium]|nr:efflux RND transporter permease subunit [Stellaceae bacterium]